MSTRTAAVVKSILLNLLMAGSGINFAIASTNDSGLTGQYSCVVNRQVDAHSANLSGENGIGVGIISYFDFSKKSGSMIMTLVDNFGVRGTVGSQKNMDFTFSEVKHASMPNTYLLTARLIDGSSTVDFFSMPVNGGNTLLITSGVNVASKAPWSGVCQKI